MKKRITKLISSLLITALTVGALPIFAFAGGAEQNEPFTVFNRGFDDGWKATNGGRFIGDKEGEHNLYIGEEPSATGINRYVEMISATTDSVAAYYQITPPKTLSEYTEKTEFVLEFDVRSNGMISGDTVILYTKANNSTGTSFYILRQTNDALYFNFGGKKILITEDYTQWVHITVSFVADYAKSTLTATLDAEGPTVDEDFKSCTGQYKKANATALYPEFFRFQCRAAGSDQVGDHVAFDNISYVAGSSTPIELDGDDYGYCVDTGIEKTEPIGNAAVEVGKSKSEFIKESYLMKTGVHRAYVGGEVVNIFSGELSGEYGAPVVIGGVTYVPLVPLLQYMGYYYSAAGNTYVDIAVTATDDTTGAITTTVTSLYIGDTRARIAAEFVELSAAPATVRTGLYGSDGNEITYTVIPMNDVERLFPGWYITYDSMGFIMLAGMDDLFDRETDLNEMASLLKKFVPDYPDTQTLYDDLSEATNNFDHPYLMTNEDELDFLRSVYRKEYLLSDGSPNTEFISECGMSLEALNLLYDTINYYVLLGSEEYVAYIVPRDHPTLTTSSGTLVSMPNLFDSNGKFIYPYTQDMKGEGKVVFASNYTSKGTASKKYDHIQDDYVIVESNKYYTAKKNYVYNAALDTYERVNDGEGVFDYVYDDYVILRTPSKNYVYDTALGAYKKVEKGTGTHDSVGYDKSGNPAYAVLRTPQKNYSRTEYFGYIHNLSFPALDWTRFGTDASCPETYLEFESNICLDCGEDHFGYDPDGQRMASEEWPTRVVYMAIAYQMTGEMSFARLAYDVLDIFGGWEHWGPAHALNMAGAAGQYAIALDLIYDAVVQMSEAGETNYKGEPMDVRVLEGHLWDKGVGEDYVMSVLREATLYTRDDVDTPGYTRGAWAYYADNTNNWGNVCNGYLALAAMGLLSYTDVHSAETAFAKNYPRVPTGKTYQELSLEVLENKFWYLPTYAADAYLENGAYTESPGYWGYGTNRFMLMLTALYNITGQDYGLLDCPGYDKTFFYVVAMETHVKGSEYVNFNYNDGNSLGAQTDAFFTAGLMLNQPDLISIRYSQIKNGKTKSLCDLFMFRRAVSSISDNEPEMRLDYCEPAADLFTTRKSWDEGALFAGIIGGKGITNHGHSDSGSWVYHNEGIHWILDFESESYDVRSDTDYPASNEASDWNSSTQSVKLHNRFRYYRLSTEGHNTLFITGRPDTLPYGHRVSYKSSAELIPVTDDGAYVYSDDYGAFSVLDMSDMLVGGNGEAYTTSAYRGMLLTNDRNTLIIQDEVDFVGLEQFAWCAHVNLDTGRTGVSSISISSDGKSAFIHATGGKVCRLSIVLEAEDDRVGFEVRKTDPIKSEASNVYLLDSTFPFDSHLELGGDEQKDRSTWRNLIITASNNGKSVAVKSVKMAVVIEVFSNIDLAKRSPVNYKYTPMAEWETCADGTYVSDEYLDEDKKLRSEVTQFDIDNVIIKSAEELTFMAGYDYKIYEMNNVYEILTSVGWTLKGLGGIDRLNGYGRECAEILAEFGGEYQKYVSAMNSRMDAASRLSEVLY